jgi:hypothetical protein
MTPRKALLQSNQTRERSSWIKKHFYQCRSPLMVLKVALVWSFKFIFDTSKRWFHIWYQQTMISYLIPANYDFIFDTSKLWCHIWYQQSMIAYLVIAYLIPANHDFIFKTSKPWFHNLNQQIMIWHMYHASLCIFVLHAHKAHNISQGTQHLLCPTCTQGTQHLVLHAHKAHNTCASSSYMHTKLCLVCTLVWTFLLYGLVHLSKGSPL